MFPEIRAFVEVRTLEVSGLTISVYDNKDAADSALTLRVKHHENAGLADIFAHEGTIGAFYVEEEQLGHLLKSVSLLPTLIPQGKVSIRQTRQHNILRHQNDIGLGHPHWIESSCRSVTLYF